ncbi:MAG: proprotein convertase P-domain-containing protein, partial [Anaerolineales bacterium]|nr:proprotein convertase P-domain-containing protein [Anaerolineales bacterium]
MNKYWMGSIVGILILALVAAAVVAGSTSAGSGTNDSDLEITRGDSEETRRRDNAWVSVDSGQVRVLAGADFRAESGTPEEMAAEFLRSRSASLGLKSALLNDLEHSFTHSGPAGHTVRFDQFYAGIPVYRGEIAVHLNHENTVTFVANNYQVNTAVAELAPGVTAAQARAIAYDYLDVQPPLRFQSDELVILSGKQAGTLAYRVLVIASSPLGDWEVLVDAHSGDILNAADIALYQGPGGDDPEPRKEQVELVDGTGNVFAPDPLSSSGAAYGGNYADNGDADTAQLTAELVNVPLLDIQEVGGIFTLIGPWAQVVDVEPPSNGLFSQASSNFSFTRNPDAFEAVNGYYHIDRFMRYVNLTLGIPVTPIQYVGGVKFDPSGFNGADNSRYSSVAGDLSFGEGGVDDAEDADVLIHELGHGLHDWLTGGNLSQVNGLSEGVGDYVAQSYSRAYGQWTPADPEYHWVFNWDGHNPFWSGRITNYGAVYPGGLTGSIHTDGQIWSTCNMKIWDAIGQQLTDAAQFEGLAMTNSSTNQEQAANAVLQAAIDMGYSGADLATMKSLFESCGYVMIDLPGGDFSLDVTPTSQSVCAPNNAIYSVDVVSIGGFSQPVTLSTAGTPAGTTSGFNPNPVNPPGTSSLTIGNTGAASTGSYLVDVVGVSATATHTATIGLDIADTPPGPVMLISPPNGTTGLSTEPSFTWSVSSGASEYLLEIASDVLFNTVVYTATATTNSHTVPGGGGLDPAAQYYWRVTPDNACGAGKPTAPFSFTTGNLICSAPGLAIPDDNPAGVADVITIQTSGEILDLDVYFDVSHTYVGDLAFTLTHTTTATTVMPIDRAGFPASTFGCSGNDIDATIDDEAASPVEDECAGTTPTIQGSFHGGDPPDTSLMGDFDGEQISGSWVLEVVDNAFQDTGTLNEWCLMPTVESAGVSLSPPQTGMGDPGASVEYTFNLMNTGTVTDTFDLTDSGVWSASLSTSSLGPLAPGASGSFTLTVTIPAGVGAPLSDVTTVT